MVQHFYITVKTIGLRVIQKTKNGKNRILQLKKNNSCRDGQIL